VRELHKPPLFPKTWRRYAFSIRLDDAGENDVDEPEDKWGHVWEYAVLVWLYQFLADRGFSESKWSCPFWIEWTIRAGPLCITLSNPRLDKSRSRKALAILGRIVVVAECLPWHTTSVHYRWTRKWGSS
jgi:hypothetical protein